MERKVYVIKGEEKINRYPGLEIHYKLPFTEVIINEEFKHLFKGYKEIPDKPGYIIVKRSEYEYIIFG